MNDAINRDKVKPYVTKDTSEIRELINPSMTPHCHNLSLAEATLAEGKATEKHLHPKTEEIYYFLQGCGIMTVAEKEFAVTAGDCVFIPASTPHQCRNTGAEQMRLLCHCAPAYSHDDTILRG